MAVIRDKQGNVITGGAAADDECAGRNHEGHEVHEAKIVTFVICAVRLPVHGGL